MSLGLSGFAHLSMVGKCPRRITRKGMDPNTSSHYDM
jgi:hypothetical protein